MSLLVNGRGIAGMSICSWYILHRLPLGIKHIWIRAKSPCKKMISLKDESKSSSKKSRSLRIRQSNIMGSTLSGLGRATKPFAAGRLLGVTWPPGLPREEPLPGLHIALGGGPISLETVHGNSNCALATSIIYRDSSKWRVG